MTDFPTDSKGKSFAKLTIFKFSLDKYEAVITQIGVMPCDKEGNVQKRSRGKSDDSFYQNHPELHLRFPRAYSRTKITEGDKVISEVITRGFYKFSGIREGDEDDSDAICTSLIPKDLENSYDTVLWTEKLNGKSVVLTSFKIGEKSYLLGGSKGVHRIIDLDFPNESIDNLDSNSQKHVKPIFQLVLKQLDGLEDKNKKALLYRLQKGETLCGEYEDGKHMVSIEKETIKWFGIVNSRDNFETQPSLTGDILVNLEYLRDLGLPTPKFELLSPLEDKERSKSMRYERNSEGIVKHFILQDETVFVQKAKVIWYVLIRVLRQIIMNNPSHFAGACKTRLLDRNKFLCLHPKMLVVWYRLFIAFGEWFKSKGYSKDVVGFSPESLGMGVVWKEFLDETKHNDDFKDYTTYMETHELEDTSLEELNLDKLMVVLQGIQGSGKTTLAKLTQKKYGDKCVTLEQDEFGGDTKLCQAKLNEYLQGDYEVIILARCNINENHVKNYVKLATEANYKVLVVTPTEFSTRLEMKESLIEHCEKAVTERVGHATFDKLKIEDRLKFTRSFANQFTPLPISDNIHLIEEMDFLKLNKERRNLNEMRDHLHRLILKNLYAKREPLYIAAVLEKDDKDLLEKSISKQILKKDESTREYLHHLTFMHSLGIRRNRQLWNRLKDLRDETVTIRIKSVVSQDSNMVLKCSVDGLNHIVASEHPHITAYIDKDKSAYHSVSILKQLAEEKKKPEIKLAPWKSKVEEKRKARKLAQASSEPKQGLAQQIKEGPKEIILDEEIVLKLKVHFIY